MDDRAVGGTSTRSRHPPASESNSVRDFDSGRNPDSCPPSYFYTKMGNENVQLIDGREDVPLARGEGRDIE